MGNVIMLTNNVRFEKKGRRKCKNFVGDVQNLINGILINVLFLILCCILTTKASNLQIKKRFEKFQDLEREYVIKRSILNHLNIKEAPVFTENEFKNFNVPLHVQSQYNFLKTKHNRVKRGSSLAALYHSVQQNPGIPGEILYTDPFREKLQFDMENRIPVGSVVTMAELRLFKKLPNLSGGLPKPPSRRHSNNHQNVFLRNQLTTYMKPIRHARVSIYHTLTNEDGTSSNHLIDSRLIVVNGSGWQAFDVTEAVHQWQKHPTRFMSMKLEMWIEGTRPGKYAASISRLVRFSSQSNSHGSEKPELVVFTEKEEVGRGRICKTDSNKSKRKCCRDSHYIDFKAMEWSQFWIIEPKGYDAFSCSGRCNNSQRRLLQGNPRTCSVSKSAPLPVMFLVKEGSETKVEVAEFPNMIVERCGCALDPFFTV